MRELARTGLRQYLRTLVFSRPLETIDDERLERRARRLELETELLLNGREDGRRAPGAGASVCGPRSPAILSNVSVRR